jgi:Rrf2 family protein
MLRLNKKTEYALLALRVMGLSSAAPRAVAGTSGPNPGADGEAPLVTAKEIASRYRLPETLLAKVLQTLKRAGIVSACKGSGGGYRLARPLETISLAELFGLFDDHVGLVECLAAGPHNCQQEALCDIRGPLEVLGEALLEPLRALSVRALFDRSPVPRVETPSPRKAVFRVQSVAAPRVTP